MELDLMIYEYTKEKTLLTPPDTRVQIVCWLGDCSFINHWNRYDEYYFNFYPLTQNDHHLLREAGEAALTKLLMSLGPYSKKHPRGSYENKDGSFYCSQLFLPKMNVEFQHPDQLYMQQASLKLHFRDDPLGLIHLQAEYVDLMEPCKIQIPVNPDKEEAKVGRLSRNPQTDDLNLDNDSYDEEW